MLLPPWPSAPCPRMPWNARRRWRSLPIIWMRASSPPTVRGFPHRQRARAFALRGGAGPCARSRRRRHLLPRVVLRLLSWPLRAGHRRARSRRHDRWNLGRLVCRILAGDRPLPVHASRVRLLRALSGPLCPRGAGERGRPQPAAGAEDQRRRQGRLDRHAPDHRSRGARRRQPRQRSHGRAARCIAHGRQQDELAGREDAHHRGRLLHGRTHHRPQAAAQKNGIALAHGAAASSSLPGIIGPTLSGSAIAWMAACAPIRRTSTS